MPPPLDQTKRDGILASIQAIADETAPERSCGSVAREHGVHPSTVSRLATEAELSHVWQRCRTKRALEAKAVDIAEERAALKVRWMAVANDLLDQLDEPFVAYSFGGKDNDYNEHRFDRPPVDAVRSLVTSAAIASDKHVALHKLDVDDKQHAAVDAWLSSMMGDDVPVGPAAE